MNSWVECSLEGPEHRSSCLPNGLCHPSGMWRCYSAWKLFKPCALSMGFYGSFSMEVHFHVQPPTSPALPGEWKIRLKFPMF